MRIKSVHTDPTRMANGNRRGKYCTAVYEVQLPDMPDEWIVGLFNSYGKSSTPFNVVHHDGKVRWYELIANSRQTTRADLVNKIAFMLGWDITDERIEVSTLAAVPFLGVGGHSGSPRKGTKQRLKHAKPARGIAAR